MVSDSILVAVLRLVKDLETCMSTLVHVIMKYFQVRCPEHVGLKANTKDCHVLVLNRSEGGSRDSGQSTEPNITKFVFGKRCFPSTSNDVIYTLS